jgi:hypothetical protein
MARKQDPVSVFEAGKRGVRTIYNALSSDDPAIQLAGAKAAADAARRLPDLIGEELRARGDERRRTRSTDLAAIT